MEDELGSMEPEAMRLRPEDFDKGTDYVKSFINETRKLHRSDARNEQRRRESLGYSFKTENLHPAAFRKPLVDKSSKPHPGAVYHLTAMVPIMKEKYKARFNGTKKPTYIKIESEYVREPNVLGILTAGAPGYLPPVTLCE